MEEGNIIEKKRKREKRKKRKRNEGMREKKENKENEKKGNEVEEKGRRTGCSPAIFSAFGRPRIRQCSRFKRWGFLLL